MCPVRPVASNSAGYVERPRTPVQPLQNFNVLVIFDAVSELLQPYRRQNACDVQRRTRIKQHAFTGIISRAEGALIIDLVPRATGPVVHSPVQQPSEP